ncbi:MAG: VTT domain-containing protein [Cyclobacteriaceae bacterium]
MEDQKKGFSDRAKFLLRNLLKGLLWLAVLVTAYIYVKRNYGFDLEVIMGPLYEQPVAIFSIFLISEVVFGIIPPEFFMIWSLRHEALSLYIENVLALTLISYAAGMIGYYLGSKFGGSKWYRLLKMKVFGKFEKHFNQYGGFLVVVAALTPLPFSGICMLVGAVKYNFRRFVWISMMRFVRFIAYAFVIWEANIF